VIARAVKNLFESNPLGDYQQREDFSRKLIPDLKKIMKGEKIELLAASIKDEIQNPERRNYQQLRNLVRNLKQVDALTKEVSKTSAATPVTEAEKPSLVDQLLANLIILREQLSTRPDTFTGLRKSHIVTLLGDFSRLHHIFASGQG
jgi:hypothetical protein